MATVLNSVSLSNTIGTSGNDSFSVLSPNVVIWGRAGNDTFSSNTKYSPVFLIGGSGNDTYMLDGLSNAVIAEYGVQDSQSDTVVLRNIPQGTWVASIIDNRHLFAYIGGSGDNNMDFLLLDFFANSNGIEYVDFQSGGGGLTGRYTREGLQQYIKSLNAPQRSWKQEDAVNLGGFLAEYSISEVLINDSLSILKMSPDEVISNPIVRGNSLYTIVDGPSWTQAEANSVKLGGHLVTINDVSENEFLANQGDLREKLDIEPWALNQIFGVTSTKASQSAWIGRERFNLGDWEWSSTDNSEYVSALLPSRYIPSFPIQSIGLHQVEQFFIENKREDLQPVATQLIYFDPLNGSEKKGAWSEIFDVDSMYDLDKDGRYSALSDGFSHHDNSKQGISETSFIRRGDSAYVIVQGPTWEEAEANAVKLGGHLVTINDAAENEWIFDNGLRGWIGFTDKVREGAWVWSSGEPVTYTNWLSDSPSNTWGTEHYANNGSRGWGDSNNIGDGNGGPNIKGIAEIKLAPNNAPTGTPILSGTTKVGQVISIDKTPIQDADNFTGYTPTYNYSFEVSNDNGTTWTKLTSTDATDNNTTYTLTTAEVGKKVRGVVSYLDGYGTNEVVPTAGSAVITNPSLTNSLIPGVENYYTSRSSLISGIWIPNSNGIDGSTGGLNYGWPGWDYNIGGLHLQPFSILGGQNGDHVVVTATGTGYFNQALNPIIEIWDLTTGEVVAQNANINGVKSITVEYSPASSDHLYGGFLWSTTQAAGTILTQQNIRSSAFVPTTVQKDQIKNSIEPKTIDASYGGQQLYGQWDEQGRGNPWYSEWSEQYIDRYIVHLTDFAVGEQVNLAAIVRTSSQKAAPAVSIRELGSQGGWYDIAQGNSQHTASTYTLGRQGETYVIEVLSTEPGFYKLDIYSGTYGQIRQANRLGSLDKLVDDNPSPPAPLYAVNPSTSTINESATLTTTVATTNVASGTTLYWSVGGTGVNASDFSSGVLTGSGSIGADGKFSFAHTAANDLTTEGDETLQIKLFSDSACTIQVGSTASVTLKDTSLTPAPTYSLTLSASSINEGGNLTTTVSTTGVTSGTTLYYGLSGAGVTAADFSSGALTGSGAVGTDGKFSFAHTAANDLTTEGDETLQIKLFSDSARTAQVGSTANVTVKDTSLTSTSPTQKVYTEKSEISYKPTGVAALPLLYTTSSSDANLSGLTLNVHYNSSILTPSGANNGVSSQLAAAITTTTILPDTNNSDGDPLTDKIVQLLWATFDNSFPNKTLPAPLAAVSFNTASIKNDPLTGQPFTTTVRYTASENASGYDFLTGFTTFKAQQFNLDVDGDGKVTALGDGLMLIRKFFGPAFAGDALTYKAISPEATRTTSEIHDFIQQGIDAGVLDVDKDGKTTALGDGLMVIRRLFGAAFDGASLTNKAISPSSPYFGPPADFASVAFNIDAVRPTIF